jgi:putative transposase
MRITRSQEQWQTIIDDQQTSGLTTIDYCQQQQLSTSSFYAVKKKLGLTSSNFVRAKITQQVKLIEAQALITLAWASALGMRKDNKQAKNYLMDYFSKVSPINKLIGNCIKSI